MNSIMMIIIKTIGIMKSNQLKFIRYVSGGVGIAANVIVFVTLDNVCESKSSTVRVTEKLPVP